MNRVYIHCVEKSHDYLNLTTPTYSINSVDGGNTLAHDVGNDTGEVDKWTLCVCMCVRVRV